MFIDCHLHTIARKGLPRNDGGNNFATPEELITMMNRTGVDKGVLLPDINPESHNYSPTEDILDVVAKYPDRFIPFCNIDPRAESNSPDANLSRQLRYYKERGCMGVGEVEANIYFDDPLTLNLFKHCEACELPVLFHIGPQSGGGCYGLIDDIHLPRLEKCLRLFPKLIFIGHAPPFWAEISADVTEKNRNAYPPGKIAAGGALPRLLDAYPNLHGDISAGSGYNALTRDTEFGYRFMEKYQDRLLFGTDTCSPKNNHKHAEFLRKAFADGCISKTAFEKISWQNLNRILRLGI